MVDADNEYIGIERLTDEELKAALKKVEENAQRLHEERKRRAVPAKSTKPAKTPSRAKKKTPGKASA